MIHGTELNVGNVVKHGHLFAEIKSISENNVSLKSGQYIIQNINLYSIFPIYLSDKWLLKSGFIQDKILFEKDEFAVKKWEIGGTIEWIFFLGQTKIFTKNDISLHQFSNFYFIVTGELLDFGDF